MSREGKLVKNTLLLSLGTVFPKLVVFITLPILTACLTKEEFGYYDLITILSSLILPGATLQIETAAFRFLIDVRHDTNKIKTIVSSIFVFVIVISVVVLVLQFFLLPGNRLVRCLVSVYFFADILARVGRQIARGLERNFDYSVSTVISAFGNVLFLIVFVHTLGKGLVGAVITLLLSSFFSFIVLLIRMKLYNYIDLKLARWREIRELLSYSWPMVPNSMSLWVVHMADRLIVTMFMGLSANAVYAVANKIPAIITVAQHTFTMAWQENASIAINDDDAEIYFSDMFKTVFNFMAGVFGLVVSTTPILYIIIIRGSYRESFLHMPILFIAMFFYSLCAYLGGIYIACKDTKSIGITTMTAALIKIIICLATIKWIGLYAASISMLIGYLILLIYRMLDVRKLVKIKYDLRHVVIVSLILVSEAYFCFLQKPILNVVNIIISLIVFLILNKTLIRNAYKKIKEKRCKKSNNN